MSSVLRSFGLAGAGTATFCGMLDKFFECLNVRNLAEYERKRKPMLVPYTDVNDERFTWLQEEFL